MAKVARIISKFNRIGELLCKEQEISDIEMMISLNFSPPNWKVWKPKLLELSTEKSYIDLTTDDFENNRYLITYSKQNKTWKLEKEDKIITVEE